MFANFECLSTLHSVTIKFSDLSVVLVNLKKSSANFAGIRLIRVDDLVGVSRIFFLLEVKDDVSALKLDYGCLFLVIEEFAEDECTKALV